MKKIIVVKIDDPDDSFYHSILSLLSSQSTDVEIITGADAKIPVDSGLTVHPSKRRVFSNNSEVTLTRKEYDILIYFLQNLNHVLTFTQLFEHVWKEPDYGTGQDVVSHHVRSLRRKLRLNETSSYQIRSVRGIGYIFEKK